MTTMTDEDEYMDMDENLLKLPQKQHFLILEDEKEENENKRTKFTSFSELNDDQLNVIFSEGLRFEICSAFITYEMFDRLKLFGAIQVAAADFSPDPLLQHNVSFDVFNREFNDPLRVPCYGDHVLHTLNYNSLPVSSTSAVRIAAKLYLTSDKVDDIENLSDDYDREPPVKKDVEGVDDLMMKIWADFGILEQESFNLKTACTLQTPEAECVDNETEWDDNEEESVNNEAECVDHEAECVDNESECIDNEAKCVDNDSGCVVDNNEAECVVDNEAFQVCDKHVIIELSDKPNGGSGSCEIQGQHGSLKLFYVAVKYAVDADLELELCLTSKETKVTGTIMAYYSQDFDYDDPEFDCQVTLFEASAPAFVTPGRIKLIRSVLAVPAKSSLIIGTNLYDSTTVVQILTDTFEFPVPRDCRSSYGSIVGDGCSLNLKVNWKQPSQEVKIPSPPSNSSSVSRDLDEIRALDTLAMADSDESNRWSLQEEIAKVFNTSLKRTFKIQEAVPCISTCTKEDGGDYLCSSVMHIWPEIKKTRLYKGPKHAGLAVKDNIMVSDYNDMMERCVVCGPGFVKFKLCRKWIAQSIHTMLTVGIETWAPKLNVEKVIICFMSQNIAEEMNMGHLRSKFIGETLALMHEFSGVVVLRKRIHDNVDSLDNKYICFCEYYTREIPDLFWENGLLIGSEGDELPLVDLTDYGHDLCLDQADCVVHVGHRYSMCEMCINAAAFSAGRIYPNVIHVGIGLVCCDDFDTEVGTIVDLLDEAKSRCKALLVRQGMADEWTAAEREHAAEALKHGAFKYAHLMNNRLINHTFSFDQMLNEEGNTAVYLHYTHARICSIIRNSNNDIKELMAESLILKHDDERELGLHLLRFTEWSFIIIIQHGSHIVVGFKYLVEICGIMMANIYTIPGNTNPIDENWVDRVFS